VVIDLRALLPARPAPILASVRKTNKLASYTKHTARLVAPVKSQRW